MDISVPTSKIFKRSRPFNARRIASDVQLLMLTLWADASRPQSSQKIVKLLALRACRRAFSSTDTKFANVSPVSPVQLEDIGLDASCDVAACCGVVLSPVKDDGVEGAVELAVAAAAEAVPDRLAA